MLNQVIFNFEDDELKQAFIAQFMDGNGEGEMAEGIYTELGEFPHFEYRDIEDDVINVFRRTE